MATDALSKIGKIPICFVIDYHFSINFKGKCNALTATTGTSENPYAPLFEKGSNLLFKKPPFCLGHWPILSSFRKQECKDGPP